MSRPSRTVARRAIKCVLSPQSQGYAALSTLHRAAAEMNGSQTAPSELGGSALHCTLMSHLSDLNGPPGPGILQHDRHFQMESSMAGPREQFESASGTLRFDSVLS